MIRDSGFRGLNAGNNGDSNKQSMAHEMHTFHMRGIWGL